MADDNDEISNEIRPHALSHSTTLITGGSSLAWRNITVEVPLPGHKHQSSNPPDIEAPHPVKKILNNVSGYVKPGQILYIMGPSGSGKSTILDSLADRVKLPVQGVQMLDGKTKTPNSLKSVAKYVQQTDDLLGVLTVTETFQNSAALYRADVESRPAVVEDVINILGLSAHRDVKIGNVFVRGLSGGQIRRVSIGCELVASPSLIFLDEPTSGLDSATAFKVVGELKRIAKATGMAMVVTVHQPSELVFEMADSLLLITGGKTAYFGSAHDAEDHFKLLGYNRPPRQSNIEWMLDLINKDFEDVDTVDAIVDAWPKSNAGKALEDELDLMKVPHKLEEVEKKDEGSDILKYPVSFWQQTRVLTKRGVINSIRNPSVLWLRFFIYWALSVLIGVTWLRLGTSAEVMQDYTNGLFFVTSFMTFMSISVLPAYLEERSVLIRERANGAYSVAAYILSHTLYEIPYVFMLSAMGTVVVYFLMGLTLTGKRIFVFLANLFVTLFVAESIMVLIAAVIPILIVGIAAAAFICGLYMCVMGGIIDIDDIGWWVRWVKYLSLHYYAFSTFVVNNFRDEVYDAAPNAFPPFFNDVPGEQVYENLGLEDRIWLNFVILFVMIVFYRALAAGYLHFVIKGKR